MEDGRNRRNGAQVHRIERVLPENTTRGPRFSNRNAVLNPKSNLKVRSEPQSRAQRRIDESQRGPIAPLSAITGLPCHNRLSAWSMGHGSRVMTLRSNSPMFPLATIVLRSYSPRAQVQSCHKLRHKPKPDLTHQPGLPETKISARRKKATRLGGFQVSMVSEAGFEPARPVCGH